MVGGQTDRVGAYFTTCTIQWTVDNRLAVHNEEQGRQVAICRGPREAWPQLWQRFRHVD